MDEFILNFINKASNMHYCTDVSSKIIFANETTANLIGYNNILNIQGLSYYDMKCKAVEYADNFIMQDKRVLANNNPLKILGCFVYANDNYKILMGEKSSIKNDRDEAIGVNSCFIDITKSTLIRLLMPLLRRDLKYIEGKTKQFCYYLEENYVIGNLTKCESHCLFYLMRGKTYKEIAYILNISPKTVEDYVDKIKIKFDCVTKSEVITKGIELGMMETIPEGILVQS